LPCDYDVKGTERSIFNLCDTNPSDKSDIGELLLKHLRSLQTWKAERPSVPLLFNS
jgi:hypothetical protein